MSTGIPVFENAHFRLSPCQDCLLPGYLILSLLDSVPSLGDLSGDASSGLGPILARAAASIERVVGAERVYVLSFCEVNRQLHFHLLPRTAWLLELYQQEHGSPGQPVDGPLLVAWARDKARRGGIPVPAGEPDSEEACHRIAQELGA